MVVGPSLQDNSVSVLHRTPLIDLALSKMPSAGEVLRISSELPTSPCKRRGRSDVVVDQTHLVLLAGDFKNSFCISYIFHRCRGQPFGERSACWSRTSLMSCTHPFTRSQNMALAFGCAVIYYLLARLIAILLIALFPTSPK